MCRVFTLVFALILLLTTQVSGQSEFIRGDVNVDGALGLPDATLSLSYMFLGGTIDCVDAADTDDNGVVSLTDPILTLRFLFVGGPPPAPPFPGCGLDSGLDSLDCLGPVVPCSSVGSNAPLLEDADPPFACAGDEITLNGFNFSPVLAENVVTFVSDDDSVTLLGRVTSFMSFQDDPLLGQRTSLTVVVPTGVRSGTLQLRAPRRDNGISESGGSVPFSGCPVIVASLFGDDGDLGFFSTLGGSVSPANVVLVGYNLAAVTNATFVDSSGNSSDATVTAGTGGANYIVPAGMSAVSVLFPSAAGLLIDCPGGGASDSLRLSVEAAGIAPAPLQSNVVEVQITTDASLGVNATCSAAVVSSGVRRGDIAVTFNLLQLPAADRWDVVPHYENPTVAGDFIPCTPRIPDFAPQFPDVYDGTDLLPGTPAHPSRHAGLMGRGASYTFVWDSQVDLPGVMTTTRLRLQPTDPVPGATSFCTTSTFITGDIAIDNTAPISAEVVEDFSTTLFLDPSQTTALWGPGVLSGSSTPSQPLPTGTGTVDVICEAFGNYVFDTDTAEVIDETDPGNPLLLLTQSSNPGAALGEFHVRTLIIDELATVTFLGSNPIVFRVSGTQDVNDTVVQLDGTIQLDGEAGTAATLTVAGSGGRGAHGGGDGGAAAILEVDPTSGVAVSLTLAENGGNFGGRAGQSISYVRTSGVTVGRAGAGGGGGHAVAGANGNVQLNAAVYVLPGLGGPARGDSRNTDFVAGAGGGGGGAVPYRPTTAAPITQIRLGGGGGGGGGAFAVVSAGSVEVNGTVSCVGGDGARGALPAGGGGGGGSGGSITVRSAGNIVLGPNSLLLARGGQGAGVLSFLGGDGADGRIRLEFNGSLSGAVTNCSPDALTGICPEPSQGAFTNLDSVVSVAQSLPYPISSGGVVAQPTIFAAPQITSVANPFGSEVILLLAGAAESLQTPGTPAEFGEGVDDPALLVGAEFVRMQWLLFSSPAGIVPSIDGVEIPVDFTTP